jgi:hypothetical protein
VPVNQPGVRFTVTRHNSLEDIDDFVRLLATSFLEAQEHGAELASTPSSMERLPSAAQA